MFELYQNGERVIVGSENYVKKYIDENDISTGHIYVYDEQEYWLYWNDLTDELPEIIESFDVFDL